MHYRATGFANKPGAVTISSKEKDIPFGLVPELSPLDIKQANLLYKYQCGQLSNNIMLYHKIYLYHKYDFTD